MSVTEKKETTAMKRIISYYKPTNWVCDVYDIVQETKIYSLMTCAAKEGRLANNCEIHFCVNYCKIIRQYFKWVEACDTNQSLSMIHESVVYI